MKQILAITFCLLSLLKSTAQSKNSCDSLIQKQYKISEAINNQHFLEEVKAAILCKYDSLDMYIFMGPNGNMPLSIIAPLAMKRIGTVNEDKVSMSEIMQVFSSIRNMPDYGELRNKTALIMQASKMSTSDRLYESRPVKEKKANQVAIKSDKQKIIENLYAFTDYIYGLSKAKESGKPLLLYFNAYGSIPARMFEDQVLRDPQIQELINNRFEFVCLFVDDRTPLIKEKIYYSKSLRKDVKFFGEIYQELQLDKFESVRQPIFFILDKTGTKIASSTTTKVKEFVKFLSAEM